MKDLSEISSSQFPRHADVRALCTVLKTKVHVHNKISMYIIDHGKFIQSIEISIKKIIYTYAVLLFSVRILILLLI